VTSAYRQSAKAVESEVRIASFGAPHEAALARAYLESEGIPCRIADDFLVGAGLGYEAAFGGVLHATLAGMKKTRKRRRRGATETIGVSIDRETKRALKTLAEEKHGGNVSALISEMTAEALRQAAFERAWRWYGGPEPDATTRAKLDAELDEGWKLARKHARRMQRRRTAA
jgi:hypothetical protein